MSEKNNIEVDKLIELLSFDLSRIFVDFDNDAFEEPPLDISEYEFLEFAENDLKDTGAHGLVNALSNAKRAIDCKVDKVLMAFGFRSKQNFPEKIETLREIGLVAPRIINKIVRTRNYLEHEFKTPEQDLVFDAVDIATLFILLTDKTLQFFPRSIRIGTILPDRNQIIFDRLIIANFDYEKKRFLLTGSIYEGEFPKNFDMLNDYKKYKEVGVSILTPQDERYKILIQLALLESNQYVEPNDHILEFVEILSAKRA